MRGSWFRFLLRIYVNGFVFTHRKTLTECLAFCIEIQRHSFHKIIICKMNCASQKQIHIDENSNLVNSNGSPLKWNPLKLFVLNRTFYCRFIPNFLDTKNFEYTQREQETHSDGALQFYSIVVWHFEYQHHLVFFLIKAFKMSTMYV